METQPREIWDAMYAAHDKNYEAADAARHPWLEDLATFLGVAGKAPVLEIGCGRGVDTRRLIERGFRVVGIDYSMRALELARAGAPEASLARVDFEHGLPFTSGAFQIVVAGLSLHYFTWEQTRRIVADIRRCLRPGGRLIARFNSTNDVHHGADGRTGDYLVNGRRKRFFDGDALQRLFADGWQCDTLRETEFPWGGKTKRAWEVVMVKA